MQHPIFPYSPQVGKEEILLEVHCFMMFMVVLNFIKIKRKENMPSFPQLYSNLNNELHSEV